MLRELTGDEDRAGRAGRRVLLLAPLLLGVVALSALGGWLGRSWMQPPAPTPAHSDALVKRGRLLYLVHCAQCHGPEGGGDGPSAAEQKPPPRDFAHGAWKHGESPEAVRKVIREGVRGTAMPGNPFLSDAEIEALTAFTRSLRSPSAPLNEEAKAALKQAGFTPEESPRFAPYLELTDLDDRKRTLDDFHGKTVLLNFWGTGCLYCIKELPDLERLASEVEGLAVVSVCHDENEPGAVRKIVERFVKRLPIYRNPDGKAGLRYDLQVMPSIYLIAPSGRLVGRREGSQGWSAKELSAVVAVLREE